MKERLKELRKALDLTQNDLADRLGITGGAYSDFERGRAKLPSARVYQICKEFNVRREWLETGVGEMFEPGKSKEEENAALFETLYNGLSDDLQAAFRRFAREKLGAKIPPDPAPSPTKSQANYGSVGGDMVQN